MKQFPVRLFEYSNSTNLGDDIQTLAVSQHIDSIEGFVDRDNMSASDDPYAVIMQGWFSKNPDIFPLPPNVKPIWLGFHLGLHMAPALERPAVREYLASWGPIGCRDPMTAQLLSKIDIPAFVSGCMTTTFPRRDHEPRDRKVFLVNTSSIPLPRHYREGPSVKIDQEGASWWPPEAKRRLAAALLQTYRDHASLVITTRLHCALPCVAMGIPVIFVGDPLDSRLDPIKGIAEFIPFPNALRGEQPRTRLLRKRLWLSDLRFRDWSGYCADIEDQKAVLTTKLKAAVAALD